MVSYFVRYRGSCVDPDAFQDYYENHHAEVLRRFPKIRSLNLHRSVEWHDPLPVLRGGTLLLAEMRFDSAADLDAALRSEARRQARQDSHRFPHFAGEITHEAMVDKVIF
jgi:uncharacterized protein (TIGR02118 family)